MLGAGRFLGHSIFLPYLKDQNNYNMSFTWNSHYPLEVMQVLVFIGAAIYIMMVIPDKSVPR